jgi:MraZ protein
LWGIAYFYAVKQAIIKMEYFIGNIGAKTDAKGRVFVPADFRKILQQAEDAQLILRKDLYQDCLVLYPMSAWKNELSKLHERLDEYDEQQRDFYFLFSSDTEKVEMDANGRILIPKRYLQIAQITGDVRFIGLNDTIKIWSPVKYQEFVQANNGVFKINAQKFLSKSGRNE